MTNSSLKLYSYFIFIFQKQTDKKENKLINEIEEIEESLNNNNLDSKKDELEKIRKIKMQGTYIRSRA